MTLTRREFLAMAGLISMVPVAGPMLPACPPQARGVEPGVYYMGKRYESIQSALVDMNVDLTFDSRYPGNVAVSVRPGNYPGG